ncbi:MAG TPA: porin family protein [Gammaproteobacteria bacterium]|nr:porin family protein [Gammaproteobacteria bacterium]
MRRLVCLAALGFRAAAGQAQEVHGPYAGVSLGSFSYQQNEKGPFGIPFSDSNSSYRLFGGYQLNSAYGIEVGWQKTGDFTQSFSGFDPTVGNQSIDLATSYEIKTLRLVLLAPFSSISMYGAVGYYDADIEGTLLYRDQTQVVESKGTDSDNGATVAGGVQFDLKKVSIRGEYEWFKARSGIDTNNISVGVLFMF